MTTERTETIEMQIETIALEDLVGGIHDLAEGIIPAAFEYRAEYYRKNTDEQDDWFYRNYDLVAGAMRLISAAAQVVDTGRVNGEIKFTRGPLFEIKETAKDQANKNTAA